jgi:site-specific DNA-methyltransferase (adenine-specific)
VSANALNTLYYGDNLQVLRDHIKDESVDLVYLDPPFNSNANYNVLFRSPAGEQSHAQIEVFEDTWHWNQTAEHAFDDVMRSGNGEVAEILRAFRSFLRENDIMAYLTMMAVRLLELHRVLKPTGSLYLHCDPTASHYLKVLLDAVFGAPRFLNEIIWQRTGAHNDAKRFGRVTDTILLFSKTSNYTFNPQFAEYTPEYIEERYRYLDPDGRRFWANTATSPNPRPNMMYEWKGCASPPNGWRFERTTMERMEKENRLYYSKSGMVYVKNYLDEQKGRAAQNLWSDIAMSKSGAERLGYPTQKPVELLERIVAASSNPGDVVLDSFCGCGTTIHAAEKLGRKWIGIDVTHLAISLIEKRLKDAFPSITFQVNGTPKDLEGARALADQDKYQFQWWAVSLVDAVPYGGKKKGADSGIDGFIYFKPDGKTTEKAIVSVKGGGNVGVPMIRDLGHVVDREKAKIGVFITLAEPTKPMLTEAVKAGYYQTPYGKFPKLQILTIEELFAGKKPELPWIDPTGFKKATKEILEKQDSLFSGAVDSD